MSDSISVLHSLTSGFDAQKSGNRNIRAGRRLVRMDLICAPWKRTMTMARIYIVMLYTCQVWQGIRAGCARIREYRGSRRIKSIRRAVAENQHQEHQEQARSCGKSASRASRASRAQLLKNSIKSIKSITCAVAENQHQEQLLKISSKSIRRAVAENQHQKPQACSKSASKASSLLKIGIKNIKVAKNQHQGASACIFDFG